MRSQSPEAHLARLSKVMSEEQWAVLSRKLGLTRRQSQVVHLALQAKRDKQIAAELGLRLPTVRMHLRYAYQHLGVSDRLELAVLVFARLQQVECDC